LGETREPAAAPVEAAAAPSVPSTTAAAARRGPGEQVVRLRFARESWVQIRDRSGRKIFSKLNAPGTEQTVSGLPPLQLIVGNANGVQVTHNEQPVNLGPHTKVNVARLTLE
jgi:cytoskeleton protein RodZ